MPASVTRPLAAALALVVVAGHARAADGADPDIPFTRRVLGNGLTVIVHEDHKAPVVGVDVWYHVGSKNERPGRTGFAHLFEHLMFNGSEHADDDWFQAMARYGATGVNGTTNNDRTNYFETVPKGALDATLWLESDRMGHLLGAIDQAKLDEQRGVVQNEKRQGENEPYSAVWRLLPALTYPEGHPYSWSVIGSMEDLDAASLDDVHAWFKAYYGAANAVIAIAGDVDTEQAFALVERWFGDIPPGPPVTRPEEWIAKRTGTVRVSVEERVPQARVHMVWNTTPWGAHDTHMLELAAGTLARGEASRLRARLVTRDGLATDVTAFQDDSEIAGQFHVWATVAPGASPAAVERALDEEVARLLAEGPSADELAIEKAQVRARFLRRIERVGGFGGKADVLAMNEVFGGRPDAWKDWLADVAAATPDAVRDAARRWLSDGALVVETRPFGSPRARAATEERSAPPPVQPAADARFPETSRGRLENGMRWIAAPRPGTGTVRIDVLLDVGYAADAPDAWGTARLVGDLLTAGTTQRTGEQLQRSLERLGAEFSVDTSADTTRVTVSVPGSAVADAAELLAEVVLSPSFPEDALEVRRRTQLAAIAQEGVDARGISRRVLRGLLLGAGSPFAAPTSGTGAADVVARLRRDDVVAFHAAWFRPASATLLVVGDIDAAAAASVAQAFAAWGGGAAPTKALPTARSAAPARIHLVDRPGAPQSLLVAAQFVPARGGPDDAALDVLNTILGGSFVSRLNMNLREDKHWSYGARSNLGDERGARVLSAFASVQSDRTADSLVEIAKELRGIAGAVPPTAAEIEAARASLTLTLPGRWEATRAVCESLGELVTFGLPDDWFDGYAARIRAVGPEDLARASALVHPDSVVWLVVGDRAKVEAALAATGLGEVVVIDASGRPVAR